MLFRKSLGLFIPPLAWAPAKELQALVYLLVRTSVFGFPAADQPRYAHMHTHTNMNVSDHVGHRMSQNPRIKQNLGLGRLALYRNKADDPQQPQGTHHKFSNPKAQESVRASCPGLCLVLSLQN